ncbi:MAG: permease-like cell division protein FtsX [Bacteroidota bacterium]|nr:permease-like cell division protein FtsX [Bacteroidota bacterium]
MRRLLSAYLSSVISISLVLLLLGITTGLLLNARKVSEYIRSNMQAEVFLTEDVTAEQAERFAEKLSEVRGVAAVRLVTEEEGRQELAETCGEDFLDVFEEVAIPLSCEVTLESGYVSTDSLERVGARISAFSEAESVNYPAAFVDKLNDNLGKIGLVLALLIAASLFISFVLIGNTVRINVFNRRFTIHTMKLVGATKGFIRRPFMVRAIFQGLASALLAIGWMVLLLLLLRHESAGVYGLLMGDRATLLIVAGVVVAAGILLCLLSTYWSVNRLLAMKKEQLYY